MIRSEFAESLNLKSQPIRIVITKVGGVEEDMNSSLYKVPVCKEDGSLRRRPRRSVYALTANFVF